MTAQQKRDKKRRKNPKKLNKCNICGLPDLVKYQEKDEDTSKIEEKEHLAPCLGHQYIYPWLWNKHPDYDKFRRFFLQQQEKKGK